MLFYFFNVRHHSDFQGSADVLRDAQNVCHFVGQTNTNNFCIVDITWKSFLVALMGCQRKRASRRRPRTSSGTPKIYAILLVKQIQTTFVLKVSLENHFLCHF